MTGTKKLLAGLTSALAVMGSAQAALIEVTGTQVATAVFRQSGTIHWTADNEYLLKGIILIGNGATLTIDAGTVIRGANEVTTKTAFNADYRPGALIVERGGKIFANGTSANPIVFTDEWDNHFPWKGAGHTGTSVTRTWWYRNGSGTLSTKTAEAYDYGKLGNLHGVWGGVALCGKAFTSWDTATSPSALGTAQVAVEGIDTALGIAGGGNDDDDSSGVFKYVQIRYGGYQLASGKELNGLTFYAVGRNTEVHHVEVFNNQDDAFEWFGGTVCAKHLVAWGAGDDIFDSDCGFRGKNQFLLGVQRDLGGSKVESGASDKGMEMDGYESVAASGSLLFSASLWGNVTLIGTEYTGNGKRNIALSMRDNAAPQIFNSVFMDFGSVATMIENRTDSTGNGITLNVTERFGTPYTNYPTWTALNAAGDTVGKDDFYQVQVPSKQACIRGSAFWNIPSGLHPTQQGGSALKTVYTWIDSAAGKGPWFDSTAYSYSDWQLPSEGNVIDLYSMAAASTNAVADESNLMPIRQRLRASVTRTASGACYDVNLLDPRAANDAVSGGVYVPDSWMTPTPYRGAFGPDSNWAQGWTTVASLGVFGAFTNAPADEAAASGTFNGMSSVSGTFVAATGAALGGLQLSSVLAFTGEAGKVYQLQVKNSLADASWLEVKTFRCDVAGPQSIVDILGSAPDASKFYQIVEGSVQ
jgi:hypothetical protein